MIQFQNVFKSYSSPQGPLHVLSDINLDIAQGQIFGIIGRSGAGKSTLLRCVNWLEQPSRGVVIVNNQVVHELNSKQLRKLRSEIGMVFQHFNLLSRRDVYDNIAFPLKLMGIDRKKIDQRVRSLLDLTGLSEKIHAYPHQLSGGQKQRVAIARALSTCPKILLCDEMTSSLDPETTSSILQLVKKINKEFDLSILLITHEMNVIKEIADTVAVLDKGKIVEQANVLQLFTRPQSQIAKSFVESVFPLQIPEHIKTKMTKESLSDSDEFWHVTFVGEIGERPVMSFLLHRYPIELNIIQSNLVLLQGQTIGSMIVRISGQEDTVLSAKTTLQEFGIKVEFLGYGSSHG